MADQPAKSIEARLADLASGRKAIVDRLELLQARPRPVEEAEADVARMVASAGATIDPPLNYLAHRSDSNASQAVLRAIRQRSTPQHPSGSGPFELMCFFVPDLVTSRLSQELRRTYERLPKPISSADFAAAEGKLQRELAAVEAEIASLWWSAADSGVDLPLPDISVEGLLGLAA